jgi:hypothetical protein
MSAALLKAARKGASPEVRFGPQGEILTIGKSDDLLLRVKADLSGISRNVYGGSYPALGVISA